MKSKDFSAVARFPRKCGRKTRFRHTCNAKTNANRADADIPGENDFSATVCVENGSLHDRSSRQIAQKTALISVILTIDICLFYDIIKTDIANGCTKGQTHGKRNNRKKEKEHYHHHRG